MRTDVDYLVRLRAEIIERIKVVRKESEEMIIKVRNYYQEYKDTEEYDREYYISLCKKNKNLNDFLYTLVGKRVLLDHLLNYDTPLNLEGLEWRLSDERI